jgi:hypothetical protein
MYYKWTVGKTVRLDTLKCDTFVLFIKNSCCSHMILVILLIVDDFVMFMYHT